MTTGQKASEPFQVHQPLILQFLQDGKTITHLYPPSYYTHEHYGLLIADLIGHVARHFGVNVEDVLEWVHREIDKPTTTLSGDKVQ